MTNATQQPTTKKQRRLMRKQQKEQARQNQLRGKKIKKAILMAAPLVLIATVIIVFALKSSPSANQNITEHPGTPKMEIPEKEYDAGEVAMSAGKVKHTYEIKNTGQGDLEIDSIWTSCHCTTARLKINDKTSAEFGMDKRSILQKIDPGETGFLEVVFDPAFHGPQGMGQAVRIIYLSTNDPQNKKAEVKLLADVIQ